jgi:hypothetical protein
VPTIKVGAWRLVVIPGDHEPRHVHACYGTRNALQAVIILEANGSVTLRKVDHGLSRSQVRVARALVAEHFEALAALWENFR